MNHDVVIILDCGATNIRAMAIDAKGIVVAKASTANASQPAAENDQWHIWSLDDILQRFADCCQQLMPQLNGYHIHALSVTTFGVDGALVDKNGELLYPVISWKCPRTAAIMEKIDRYITPGELQTISGIGQFSFNTLYKLIWIKENRPELLEQAHAWLFISSLINHRLTGEFTTDRTMLAPASYSTCAKKLLARLFYNALASPLRSSRAWSPQGSMLAIYYRKWPRVLAFP